MRFNDETFVDILRVMRTVKPSRALTNEQWQKLHATDVGAAQPNVPIDWYQSCYCWSVTSPASFAWARWSAREAEQNLFYAQAVCEPMGFAIPGSRQDLFKDVLQVPSVQHSGCLPGVVFWHHGMTVRFTTTLQPPFAVQDVEGKVVGFDPDSSDQSTRELPRCGSDSVAKHHCRAMPLCIYVKLDDDPVSLLPEEFAATTEQRGVCAVKPLNRTWKWELSKGHFIRV